MKLDGVYQLKSIYYNGIEFKTNRFGIFKTINDAKDAIKDIYKSDGNRIIIEFVPFGLSSKCSSEVVFDRRFFKDDENWLDKNKD